MCIQYTLFIKNIDLVVAIDADFLKCFRLGLKLMRVTYYFVSINNDVRIFRQL